MNNPSGFQELRPSIFRSPSSRPPHEQRHQCRTDSWDCLCVTELPRMIPQTRMKNRGLLFTPIPAHSCLHIRSIHRDNPAPSFTLLERIR